MGFYYPGIQEVSALNDAANALRGADEHIPVAQQIRIVAQELFKGREAKYINPKGEMVPEEAKIVFDEIDHQINQIRATAADLIKDESVTVNVIDDMKILENFANRVFTHYKAEESPFAKKIKETLSRLIADGTAGKQIIELRNRLHELVDLYTNSVELSKEEFCEHLEQIATEMEAVPTQKERPLLWAEVHRLRTELEAARRLYLMEEPPGITAQHALDLLRISSDMVQSAKTTPEMIKALEIADEANRHLEHTGGAFLEQARPFNLLFSEKINSYLRKQIAQMRNRLNLPLVFVPKDTKRTEEIYKSLSRQIAQIRDYFDLAEKTGEHHQDLEELLTELMEKIGDRVEKMVPHLNNEQAAKFQSLI